MKMKKLLRLFCLGLALAFILAFFAGCGDNSSNEPVNTNDVSAGQNDTPNTSGNDVTTTTGTEYNTSGKVGFVLADLSNEFFAYYGNSVKEALGNEGYDVVLTSYDGEVTKAMEQIETFTNQGVEAILMMGATPDLGDSLSEARANGVKVLLAGNEIEGAYDVCLIADNTQIGGLIGQMGADHYNSHLKDDDTAEVIAIIFSYGGVDMANRGDALVDTFMAQTDIDETKFHIVEFTQDSGDTTGYTMIENTLTKFPNTKLVMTISDAFSLVALNIMNANGMTGDDYAIYGSDATMQALLEVAQANGPSIFRGTVSMGDIVSQTAENALKLLRNEFETLPFRNEGPGTPITEENVSMFLPPQ